MLLSIFILFLVGALFFFLIYKTRHHKNYGKRELDDEYMEVILRNLIFILMSMAFFLSYCSGFLFQKGWLPNIQKIIFYLFIIDTLDYWTHRIIHRTPILKEIIHLKHHDAIDLIPLDAFYQSLYDYVIYVFYIIFLPILMGINIPEAIIIYSIALSHSIYIHSEEEYEYFLPGFVNATFHKHHHQIGRGNYSIFFSTWDDYMKTRIPSPKLDQI